MKHDTVLMSVCPCSFFGRKLLNCLQISVVNVRCKMIEETLLKMIVPL